MPTRQISNTASLWGEPLSTYGMNEQIGLEVVNNSGTYLKIGNVVTWDNFTALSTLGVTGVTGSVTVSGAQSGTLASFTLTAGASTASYAAAGALIIPTVVTGTAAVANQVPVFYSYTGITGSTFTGVKAHTASVTNGILDTTKIFQVPSASVSGIAAINFYPPQVVGMPAAPSDAGRAVTLSATGAVKDPLIAGIVQPNGEAGTETITLDPDFPDGAIAPGQTFFMATQGIARVKVNTTVTALDILSTGVTPGFASSGTPTLGNLIGIALEADTAKDANNTIRVALKIG